MKEDDILFVIAVRTMREAQRRYFKERTREAIVEAIEMEREVDAAIERILADYEHQSERQS